MRFLGAVTGTHRHLFEEAIGRKYNRSYQKCLELIRECLPQIPTAVLNQRLLFMSISSFNVLITREAAIAFQGHARAYWGAPRTFANLLDYICAGLSASVSESALVAGGGSQKSPLNAGRHFAVMRG
jgi:hypothetical protein